MRISFSAAPTAWEDLKRHALNFPLAVRAHLAEVRSAARGVAQFFKAPGAAASQSGASGHIELGDEDAALGGAGGGSGRIPLQTDQTVPRLTLDTIITGLSEPPLALLKRVTFNDIAELLGVPAGDVEALCTSWHLLGVLQGARRNAVAAASRYEPSIPSHDSWGGVDAARSAPHAHGQSDSLLPQSPVI